MNADAFFCIGKTHAVCQDYAEVDGNHVIISDGCSSAVDSNIGAMLLSRAARSVLRKSPHSTVPDLFRDIKLAAYSYALALDLEEESLYATLGIIINRESDFRTLLYGDGVVAGRRKHTQTWDVSVYEFPSGAPYYLAYKLNEGAENQYYMKFGSDVKRTFYELSSNGVVCKGSCVYNGDPGPFLYDYTHETYDMVAVMSDGALSFMKSVTTSTSKRQESVPVCDILKEVLGFKNYNGQFVQRRCKAAFRQFAEENCVNLDDFSLGVMYNGLP